MLRLRPLTAPRIPFLARLRIGRKLMLLVLLPVTSMLVFTLVGGVSQWREARALEEFSAATQVSFATTALTDAVARERIAAVQARLRPGSTTLRERSATQQATEAVLHNALDDSRSWTGQPDVPEQARRRRPQAARPAHPDPDRLPHCPAARKPVRHDRGRPAQHGRHPRIRPPHPGVGPRRRCAPRAPGRHRGRRTRTRRTRRPLPRPARPSSRHEPLVSPGAVPPGRLPADRLRRPPERALRHALAEPGPGRAQDPGHTRGSGQRTGLAVVRPLDDRLDGPDRRPARHPGTGGGRAGTHRRRRPRRRPAARDTRPRRLHRRPRFRHRPRAGTAALDHPAAERGLRGRQGAVGGRSVVRHPVQPAGTNSETSPTRSASCG